MRNTRTNRRPRLELNRNIPAGGYHLRRLSELTPYSRNARRHSADQIGRLAASIERFGFINPVFCDRDGNVVAGHGRLEAARQLGMDQVPTLLVEHLSEQEIRAYRLADNRLAERSEWDDELLRIELSDIVLSIDPIEIGFDPIEVDSLLHEPVPERHDADEQVPEPDRRQRPSCRPGELWQLGEHQLLCGSALEDADYRHLLQGEKAGMIITDPPYNVPVDGHVCGLGQIRHREFSMASGEMSAAQFTEFLSTACGHMAQHSRAGSIHFIFMDWRHCGELLAAGHSAYTELKNLIVWVKTNGGMGTFYRSQHELAFAFKNGSASHTNNFGLGSRRYRTNVWRYAGVNSFGRNRSRDLNDHPTVKPVAMIADAIRDCSRSRDLILDPFCGSGTTILAAQLTGRRARCIELDPAYCDVAIRRWQELTGQEAIHCRSGHSFAQITTRMSRQRPQITEGV